jgi:hypothetical protein
LRYYGREKLDLSFHLPACCHFSHVFRYLIVKRAVGCPTLFSFKTLINMMDALRRRWERTFRKTQMRLFRALDAGNTTRLHRLLERAGKLEQKRQAAGWKTAVAAVSLGLALGAPAQEAHAQSFKNYSFGLGKVAGVAAPAFADLDGDGDMDALVGNGFGNTVYFENTGNASSPGFGEGQVDPFGLVELSYDAQPTFADLDGDGDFDVLIGDYYGNTVYFENTGSASAPAFGVSQLNPFGLSNVGNEASPVFVDVDGDGDLDAFVGERYGDIFYRENTGSSSAPAFVARQRNPFGIATSPFMYSPSPAFADLDGDGDPDLIIGGDEGTMHYFPNTGSATAPAFGPSQYDALGMVDVGAFAVPVLVDINGDGRADLLVGNSQGVTLHFENTGSALVPAFQPGQANLFGLTNVGPLCSPAFADLDGDGDMDAFIGADEPTANGKVIYFENTGSAATPAFGASQINPFGLVDVGRYPSPTLVDLDGDGDLDALIGDRSGRVRLFENTGNATAPAFGTGQLNPFGLRDVGYYATPTFADLDDDGDLDAIIGSRDGHLVYFQNTGNASAPAFATSQLNPFGISPASNRPYVTPTFADLDRDGDMDIFIGTRTSYIGYYENTGTASAPAFRSMQGNPFGMSGFWGNYLSPAFADMDADGDLDAFIGNNRGYTLYLENVTPPPAMPDNYCASSGSLVGEEWIKRVQVLQQGALLMDNFSGRDGGYGDYTSTVEAPRIAVGKACQVTVAPGRRDLARQQAYKVWIDWNRDGDFRDAGELIFSRNLTDLALVKGNFSVPADASLGYTRMRVQMKHAQVPFASCEGFSRGEVEDYRLEVVSPSLQPSRLGQGASKGWAEEAPLASFSVYPNPASGTAQVQLAGVGTVELLSLDGRVLHSAIAEGLHQIPLSGLPAGLYVVAFTNSQGNRQTVKLSVQ